MLDKFRRSDSEEDLFLLEDEKKTGNGNITKLNAFWNVCNSIQGVAILAMPYVIKGGGWWSVLALIIVAILSNYTGQILIECHYAYRYDPDDLVKKRVRVRTNFADIGRAVWPSFGMPFILVTQVLELLFMATLYPIVTGSVLQQLVPNISTPFWILIFGIIMLPNVFMKNLKHISLLSVATVISAGLVFSAVVIYCLTQIPNWNTSVMDKFSVNEFPLSVGVIVASYSSQMYLAVIEANMKAPEKIGSVMNYAYLVMTIFKIGIGMAAYFTFQEKTAQVITLNLPNGVLLTVINVIVLILAMSSYSLPMFTVFDILEEEYNNVKAIQNEHQHPEERKQISDMLTIMTRLGLVLVTLLMAILVPHFCLVLSFVGTFTGACLEFIFPCIFHLKLHYHDMKFYEFVLDIVILVASIPFIIAGLYYTGTALIYAYAHHTKEIWTID